MTYDARPELARAPLNSDDIEALLLTDGRELAGDPTRVRHLLTRLRATFTAYDERYRAAERELERRAEEARRRSSGVVAALEALRSLTTDEQRQVLDQHARVLLDSVDQAQRQAAQAGLAAASETNRARLVLAQVIQDAAVPPQVRDLLRAALDRIPLMQRPAPVPVPAASGIGNLPPGTVERVLG